MKVLGIKSKKYFKINKKENWKSTVKDVVVIGNIENVASKVDALSKVPVAVIDINQVVIVYVDMGVKRNKGNPKDVINKTKTVPKNKVYSVDEGSLGEGVKPFPSDEDD